MKSDDFLMLIRHITLWPWPVTPRPWTCMVDGSSCGQSVFQISTRSVHPRLSYWRLTSDFSFVFRGLVSTNVGLPKKWKLLWIPRNSRRNLKNSLEFPLRIQDIKIPCLQAAGPASNKLSRLFLAVFPWRRFAVLGESMKSRWRHYLHSDSTQW